MSRVVSVPRRKRVLRHPALWMVFVVGIVALTVAVTSARLSGQAGAPAPAPAAVPHFIDLSAPGTARLLVIGAATDTLPGTSNPAGVLMANEYQGSVPDGATSARVLTDSNCAPDGDGISHCLNQLDIGGRVVTVQHHHAMSAVPCLSPGETVQLMSLSQFERQS